MWAWLLWLVGIVPKDAEPEGQLEAADTVDEGQVLEELWDAAVDRAEDESLDSVHVFLVDDRRPVLLGSLLRNGYRVALWHGEPGDPDASVIIEVEDLDSYDMASVSAQRGLGGMWVLAPDASSWAFAST